METNSNLLALNEIKAEGEDSSTSTQVNKWDNIDSAIIANNFNRAHNFSFEEALELPIQGCNAIIRRLNLAIDYLEKLPRLEAKGKASLEETMALKISITEETEHSALIAEELLKLFATGVNEAAEEDNKKRAQNILLDGLVYMHHSIKLFSVLREKPYAEEAINMAKITSGILQQGVAEVLSQRQK
jgi:hypothetical protein